MGNDIAFQPLRVAVVSNSGSQRALLRDVIERNGSQVVHISGFEEYVQSSAQHQPDVLLIDLDAADDDSLNTLDMLVDQDEIPILFNDGVNVDTGSVFAKTDWEHNLMNKLYQIVGVEPPPVTTSELPTAYESMPQTQQANSPQQSVAEKNTAIAVDNSKEDTNRMPAVAVFSHSKTRRSALKTLLKNNGLEDVAGYEFRSVNIKKTVGKKQVLLIDKHNVGPEGSSVFNELTIQLTTPFIICNSSEIPLEARQRNSWGHDLVQQLIETAKSDQDQDPELASNYKNVQIEKSSTDTDSTTSVTLDDESPWMVDDWGKKLAASLAGVRENLRLIEAKKVRHQLDKLIQTKHLESSDQAETTDSNGLDTSDPPQREKHQDPEFSDYDLKFFESANDYDGPLNHENIDNDNIQRFTEFSRYFSEERDQSDRIGSELQSELKDVENELHRQHARGKRVHNRPESGKQSAPKKDPIKADQDLARSEYENYLGEDNIPLLEEQAHSEISFQDGFELYNEEETLFEDIPEIDNIKDSQNSLTKSNPVAVQPEASSGKAMSPQNFYLDFDPKEPNNNIYSLLAKWRSTIKDWRQQLSRLFG